jgi:predicted aldo/keto reductase-like oxidoreductase
MGAAGLGSVFAPSNVKAGADASNAADSKAKAEAQKPKFPQVPKRTLGKTGIEVPVLSLGTVFDLVENQVILKSALQWGVNYWDTATNYAGGNSELGIGKYLAQNPRMREKLFIVSKPPDLSTPVPDLEDVEKQLQDSLKRMNTDYIDLYLAVHGLRNPDQLTNELKQWIEKAKKRGVIKFSGYSTHRNMAQCLTSAAKLNWIDAIMTKYDFRLMQDPEMQAGIEACNKAGIGLIAIKTQARRQKITTEEDKKLAGHFLKRGFTEAQAKLKAVLEDERISSAAVGMQNVAILTSNVAAVLDKTKLTQADKAVFKEYAAASCSGYCAGCAYICESALPDVPYISDIMRYLMYYNSYGEQARARELFAKIPSNVKNRLLNIDYRPAEAHCPQHMPIGELIAEAVSKLA